MRSDPTVSIPLENNVTAEVTVTQHAAHHRFTYSPEDNQILLIDGTTDLMRSFSGQGTINITRTRTSTRVSGGGIFQPSFGIGVYKVYYCFFGPAASETVFYHLNSQGGLSFDTVNATTLSASIDFAPAGVLLKYPQSRNPLNVRMGISWTSEAQACAFGQAEVPNLNTFDATKAAAR